MKLRAVIPLSNGSIALRDTSRIYRQCHNDGAAYFASCSVWVSHTLSKAVLNRHTVAEHFIRYTIHNGINGIKNEGKHILRTRKDSANQSPRNASRCNTAPTWTHSLCDLRFRTNVLFCTRPEVLEMNSSFKFCPSGFYGLSVSLFISSESEIQNYIEFSPC